MSTKQDHKRWRKEFREGVFLRDHQKCVFCGSWDDLDAHHITDRHDMPNGGYVVSNGITVCPEHHLECEKYHQNELITEGFWPDQLYEKIGSSYEKAYEDSLNLK